MAVKGESYTNRTGGGSSARYSAVAGYGTTSGHPNYPSGTAYKQNKGMPPNATPGLKGVKTPTPRNFPHSGTAGVPGQTEISGLPDHVKSQVKPNTSGYRGMSVPDKDCIPGWEQADKSMMHSPPKWMNTVHPQKGALHRQLGIPMGQKIPTSTLEAKAHAGGKLGKRANLALRYRGK